MYLYEVPLLTFLSVQEVLLESALPRFFQLDHFLVFVLYVEEHPNANGNEAKAALSGHSDVDKFEYGYNATLGGDGAQYADYDLILSLYKEILEDSGKDKLVEISL